LLDSSDTRKLQQYSCSVSKHNIDRVAALRLGERRRYRSVLVSLSLFAVLAAQCSLAVRYLLSLLSLFAVAVSCCCCGCRGCTLPKAAIPSFSLTRPRSIGELGSRFGTADCKFERLGNSYTARA
jgi:hypothetical protein